jgi:hypothetical protein
MNISETGKGVNALLCKLYRVHNTGVNACVMDRDMYGSWSRYYAFIK